MNNVHQLKRILILDDNSDYRKLLLKHLGNMFEGAEIVEYDPLSQGAPGEDFDWSLYDVLILDYQLNLPGITGLDIFQKNKKKETFPATIMLTGAGTEELALKALDYGIYTYLNKQKLGKEELKASITDAFDKNRKTRDRLLEQTNHSQGFNKALFYQKLEKQYKGVEDAEERILLLIQLDLHDQLEEKFGILSRDNILRYIAKRTFEFFIGQKLHPSITRLNDITIALLTDVPGDDGNFKNILQEICTDTQDNPYSYKDKAFDYKISIGGVRLTAEKVNAETLINRAMAAVKTASETNENSFHILTVPGPDARPETPVTKEKKAAGDEELILDENELDEVGLKIKKAINNKMIVQMFRPVISLFSDESGDEVYYLSARLIDKEGKTMNADEIHNNIKNPALQKYFDRWMLREALGRIVKNDESNNYFFIMQLSGASLADATLFNWLRKLLTGIEGKHPGKSIALEISPHDYFELQKQSGALMSYLHNSHGFRFVIGAVMEISEVTRLPGDANFEIIRTNNNFIKTMTETIAAAGTQGSVLQYLKSSNTKILSGEISDSNDLTNAIAGGADYAMGDFIGVEMDQVDENKYVESFEIT